MARKIPRALWLVLPLAYFLFFYHLSAVGLIGQDEPRYASIAREMAASGDWITPRLAGQPWFEKPALLYWFEGAAYRIHLGPELAARLPVAILALAFLGFFWWILDREFGCACASIATAILGTSAGWIICSQVGVPDLPLTATFSAAMLLALPWIARRDAGWLPHAAALLGAAVVAKGPVALALAIPVAVPWKLDGVPLAGGIRENLRELARPRVIVPFLVVALPWYLLCTLRNGSVFLRDFFWKHNVERFTSAAALQHGQPFWFYVPVLLGALLPWTPLVPLAARGAQYRDPRRRFLLAWVAVGVVLFSVSANKLPGYILPVLPAAAILMGQALAELTDAAPWLAACAVLLVVFPIAAPMLPVALPSGLSHAAFPPFRWFWLLPACVAATAWLLERKAHRLAAVLCICAGVTAGVAYLKFDSYAALDGTASARSLWRDLAPYGGSTCVGQISRYLRYSLDFYSVTPLPDCAMHPRPYRFSQLPGQPPRLVPAQKGTAR
ncbi:MAG TPA: glycosyltransferase family 39 protein [Bryobacteraceae bacterium]|nr:glycosyltransferase family 39 protein [Bryobacteraceae bacterium]